MIRHSEATIRHSEPPRHCERKKPSAPRRSCGGKQSLRSDCGACPERSEGSPSGLLAMTEEIPVFTGMTTFVILRRLPIIPSEARDLSARLLPKPWVKTLLIKGV